MAQKGLSEVQQLLKDLTENSLAYQRREAAEKIGQLSTSSVKVVAALVYARDRDSSEDVRSAAAAALNSPIHKAVLEQRTDEVRELVTTLTRYLQAAAKSAPVREPHKSSTRQIVPLLYGIGGGTFYVLFRGISEVSQFPKVGNPYEAAMVREGTTFILFGIFGLVLLAIGLAAIAMTRNKRF